MKNYKDIVPRLGDSAYLNIREKYNIVILVISNSMLEKTIFQCNKLLTQVGLLEINKFRNTLYPFLVNDFLSITWINFKVFLHDNFKN